MKTCKRGLHQYEGRRCGDCARAAIRAWRISHPEAGRQHAKKSYYKNHDRAKASARSRYTENRDEYKAKSLERYHAKKAAGLIECSTEKTRAWRKANPERTKAHRVQHEATRRARKADASGSHTRAEWEAICARQRNLCAACGDECKLTKDHVVPLSMGGSNDASNLQGLCGPCNSRKGARMTIDTSLNVKETVTSGKA